MSSDALWIERTGTGTYTGYNGRGASVLIGQVGGAGSFSPGELLKISLAGCTGLTVDAVLARRIGDNYAARIDVSGAKDAPSDTYPEITEEFALDLSALAESDRATLLKILHRAVEEHCTIGRTVTRGAKVTLSVVSS
ncbi:OsmC family peroxiredoxin [Nakamurella antarctica]|uniref:OsmC family peroxiredoxin n=1 Tax=Nakamurella antarctica TaxID=1902245 RepID=A0A3G8ZQ12_9ACTN|nr:OsmC family peroxiredoxin [Nakamurella antarctica]